MRRARSLAIVSSVAVASVGGFVVAPPATAAAHTRYVATTGNNGPGGVNACLDSARPCLTIQHGVDEAAAGDTVSVAAGAYNETATITRSLTVRGAGRVTITAVPEPLDRGRPSVIVKGATDSITVTLDHLDLSNNDLFPGLSSGNATTVLEDSTAAGNGVAAIVSSGTLTVSRSTLDLNGTGVAVVPDVDSPAPVPPKAVVDHSVIRFSSTGVFNYVTGELTLVNSTLFKNGTGVYAYRGSTTVTNSTIVDTGGFIVPPPPGLPAAGIAWDAVGSAAAARSAANQLLAKAGVAVGARAGTRKPLAAVKPSMSVSRTILDQAASVPDCASNVRISDAGYNLSADTQNSCDLSVYKHDRYKTDPQLGPIGDHGGPTATRVPENSSPAIDVIPAGLCPADDQRGIARPQGAACDIGAVEVTQTPLTFTTTSSLLRGTVGTRFHVQFTATGGLGAPYAFSLAGTSRPLPAGLTLSTTGLLSGTPTKAGSYPITVRVGDSTSRTYSLVIAAADVIAATGADPVPLTIFGLLMVLTGVAALTGAGRIRARPSSRRTSTTS